jgi:hypothetical protein
MCKISMYLHNYQDKEINYRTLTQQMEFPIKICIAGIYTFLLNELEMSYLTMSMSINIIINTYIENDFSISYRFRIINKDKKKEKKTHLIITIH